MTPNPFEVLQLKPTTSEEEIIRQAGRLRQRARDEDALTAIRRAVQALTGKAEDRQLHALLTPPEPEYACPEVTALDHAFRRPPEVVGEGESGPIPDLDLQAFADLLRPLLVEELESPPLHFVAPEVEETAEETHRQTVEAMWQALLYDPRG